MSNSEKKEMKILLKYSIVCVITFVIMTLMNGCASCQLSTKNGRKQEIGIVKNPIKKTHIITGAVSILKYSEKEQKVKNYIEQFKSYKYHAVSAQKYADAILFACIKYEIDLDILLSLIKHESGFRASIVQANTGCIGACQINPEVWTEELIEQGILETEEDLFNIFNNVLAGAYVLRHYLDATGDMESALQRYYGICNYAVTYSSNVIKG